MHKLVFATNNRHKMEEVLAKIGDQFNCSASTILAARMTSKKPVPTFTANASIKSRFIYNKYRLNCFGDDSGLEIDALNGEPGVYSARYAGTHGDHEANMDKVISQT